MPAIVIQNCSEIGIYFPSSKHRGHHSPFSRNIFSPTVAVLPAFVFSIGMQKLLIIDIIISILAMLSCFILLSLLLYYLLILIISVLCLRRHSNRRASLRTSNLSIKRMIFYSFIFFHDIFAASFFEGKCSHSLQTREL